jgi:dTDP-4-dehydrorhamnose 3,5-epimerase
MSQRFDIQQTAIEGVIVLKRKLIGDSRGYFERLFCQQELQQLLNVEKIAQINHTLTETVGTVRGLHFQYPPHAETKIVSCINGEVFDVAVDLRKDSPTFMSYYAEILTSKNSKTLIIPEGFAHGFQTLTDNCEMLYFHTEEYHVESECALNAIDPILNIKWPQKIKERSEKDKNHTMIDSSFEGLSL